MNEFKHTIQTLDATITEFKDTINELSENFGQGAAISQCTQFRDYPGILRNLFCFDGDALITVLLI